MKKIVIFISAFIFFVVISPGVYAQEDDFAEIRDEINSTLKSAVDEETEDILDSENISLENTGKNENLNFNEIISEMWEYFKKRLTSPVVMICKITAVAILAMIVQSMNPENSGMSCFFETLCVLVVIIVTADSLSESFATIKNSLESIQTFMLTYIPVFSGTVAAGGSAVTAGSYSSVTLFICEIIYMIAEIILIPFLSVILSFTLVSAINPSSGLSDAAQSINKFVVWALGGVTSLFTLLLSIQGITGAAVDGKAAKLLKFAASSFIPVIGNSVSESVSAVRGSLGVIRAGVGVMGIAVIFIIVIRPVLAILAIKLCLWLGRIIMEIFGQSRTGDFLKNANSIMSVGLSIVICCGIVFIVSTAITMMACLPGG